MNNLTFFYLLYLPVFLISCSKTTNQPQPLGYGWANNSVNTVIFRKNSLVTFKDTQYIAFYDSVGYVVLGKRNINAQNWQLNTTPYKGKVNDAHCSISIMADGDGYIHLSWGHHNDSLNYCKSIAPGSLLMTKNISMVDKNEEDVTYPEFFKLPDGNLIFMYRFGISGRGNLVMNKYLTKEKKWVRLHDILIDGENQRNAYWQSCIDAKGTIHISWVWRETWDVSTNHDMCYAKSTDGGITWQKSTGEKYKLPINASTAEYIAQIPQNSELINQTSMCADNNGNPYIATYFTPQGSTIPQYHIIFYTEKGWQAKQVTNRKTSFSLSGGGTKKIPVSRPQIVVSNKGGIKIYLIYRDQERGNKVTVCTNNYLINNTWNIYDITPFAVDSWEPSYDTELWKEQQRLDLFVQRTEQGDGESLVQMAAQPVFVYEFNENSKPTSTLTMP